MCLAPQPDFRRVLKDVQGYVSQRSLKRSSIAALLFRQLERLYEAHHSSALVEVRQRDAYRAEIFRHVRGIGGAGDDRGDPQVTQQIFEEELRPAIGELACPVW